MDVSPRGDPPGFVRELDERTLLLPDRVGNNRLEKAVDLYHVLCFGRRVGVFALVCLPMIFKLA